MSTDPVHVLRGADGDRESADSLGVIQGRVLGANAAQAENMVDGVATFDEVVRNMRRDARTSSRPRANRLAYAQRAIEIL